MLEPLLHEGFFIWNDQIPFEVFYFIFEIEIKKKGGFLLPQSQDHPLINLWIVTSNFTNFRIKIRTFKVLSILASKSKPSMAWNLRLKVILLDLFYLNVKVNYPLVSGLLDRQVAFKVLNPSYTRGFLFERFTKLMNKFYSLLKNSLDQRFQTMINCPTSNWFYSLDSRLIYFNPVYIHF
jgi:hypothetical protein